MKYVRVLGILAAVLASSSAMAINIPNETPHAGELSVWEVYNNLYGTSYTSNVDLDVMRIPDLQTGLIPPGENLGVEAEARYASTVSEFGYYTPAGAPANYEEIFTVTDFGDVSGLGYAAPLNVAGIFGLYLDPAGEGAIWHSEQGLNWLQEDHMVAYEVAGREDLILLAWEDLPLPSAEGPNDFVGAAAVPTLLEPQNGYDGDYNDLIVELQFTDFRRNPDPDIVPEPATMVLLGLGIAGVAVRRFVMA